MLNTLSNTDVIKLRSDDFHQQFKNYQIRLVTLQVIWCGVRAGKLALDPFKSCKSHQQ